MASRVVIDIGGEQPSLGELESLIECHEADGLAIASLDAFVGDGEERLFTPTLSMGCQMPNLGESTMPMYAVW